MLQLFFQLLLNARTIKENNYFDTHLSRESLINHQINESERGENNFRFILLHEFAYE
jgi:hypothetical protein